MVVLDSDGVPGMAGVISEAAATVTVKRADGRSVVSVADLVSRWNEDSKSEGIEDGDVLVVMIGAANPGWASGRPDFSDAVVGVVWPWGGIVASIEIERDLGMKEKGAFDPGGQRGDHGSWLVETVLSVQGGSPDLIENDMWAARSRKSLTPKKMVVVVVNSWTVAVGSEERLVEPNGVGVEFPDLIMG